MRRPASAASERLAGPASTALPDATRPISPFHHVPAGREDDAPQPAELGATELARDVTDDLPSSIADEAINDEGPAAEQRAEKEVAGASPATTMAAETVPPTLAAPRQPVAPPERPARAPQGNPRPSPRSEARPSIAPDAARPQADAAEAALERTATAPQLRRFIKSRAYVPMHELRRRFAINGGDDEVTPVDLEPRKRVFVGLPEREGRLLGELLRAGDIGYELSLDPISPIVVGVYPMRPVTRV